MPAITTTTLITAAMSSNDITALQSFSRWDIDAVRLPKGLMPEMLRAVWEIKDSCKESR